MNNKVIFGVVLCVTIMCVSICTTVIVLSKGREMTPSRQVTNGDENLRISELLLEQEKERRLRLEEENKNLREKREYEKAHLKMEETRLLMERQEGERLAREDAERKKREAEELARRKKIEEEQRRQKEIEEAKKRDEEARHTMAYVNYINSVIETIRTYNNVIVLREEYDAINNNLNIDSLIQADEGVKASIKGITDELEKLRIGDKEYKRFKDSITYRKAKAKRSAWLNFTGKAADSVFDAMGNAVQDASNVSISDLSGAAPPEVVAAKKIAEISKNLISGLKRIVSAGITSYGEYKEAIDNIKDENERRRWQLNDEKLKRLHELNKEMLDKQYAWAEKYKKSEKYSDKFRITPKEIGTFQEVLKETAGTDGLTKDTYKVLLDWKERFPGYSRYWYYLAMSAVEAGEAKVALEACAKYEETNCGLFRDDKYTAGVAMAKVSALVMENQIQTNEIQRCLSIVKNKNWTLDDVDARYFCASIYAFVLNDRVSASRVLGATISRLKGKADTDLREYCDLFTPTESKIVSEDKTPYFFDLAKCRALQAQIDMAQLKKVPVDKLREICSRESTSALEKLYYVGKLRIMDLWEPAWEEIRGVNVQYCGVNNADSGFYVHLPISWMILGEVNPTIEFVSLWGEKECIKDQYGNRTLMEDRGCRYVRMYFPCPRAKLPSVDRIVLNIDHVSWPVEIEYSPASERWCDDERCWKDYQRNIFSAVKPGDACLLRPTRLISFMNDRSIAQPLFSIQKELEEKFGDKQVIPLENSSDEWEFRMPSKDVLPLDKGCLESLDFSEFEKKRFIAADLKNESKMYQDVDLGVALYDDRGLLVLSFEKTIRLPPESKGKAWLRRGGVMKHTFDSIKPVKGVVYCYAYNPNDSCSERYKIYYDQAYQMGMAIIRNGFYETIRSNGRYKGYYSDEKLLGSYKYDDENSMIIFKKGLMWQCGKYEGGKPWVHIGGFTVKDGLVYIISDDQEQEGQPVMNDWNNAVKVCDILKAAHLAITPVKNIPVDAITSVPVSAKVQEYPNQIKLIKEEFANARWVRDLNQQIYIMDVQAAIGNETEFCTLINRVNKEWGDDIRMDDVVVGILEGGYNGVLITSANFYSVGCGSGNVKIPLEDIKRVDWERAYAGSIFINDYALKFLVDHRKPFVELFKSLLSL